MGCSELVNISHGRGVCCPPSSSYLLDGLSPTSINTSGSNWASQLVTVKKNNNSAGHIDSPHVLLTFIFDRPVSPTSEFSTALIRILELITLMCMVIMI